MNKREIQGELAIVGKRMKATAVAAAVCTALSAGCGSDDSGKDSAAAAPDVNRAPASVTWQTYQGMKLPIGAEDGPKDTSSAAAHGYSHTPQGAALAAINHRIRMSVATDNDWSRVAAITLAAGPGKDAWVLARAQVSITSGVDGTAPKVSGYRVTSYAPDRAEVAVYTTFPDNSVAETASTVVWFAEDWRLQLPDPAARVPTVAEVAAVPAGAVRLEATA
jgi:hypothetical protein